MMGTLLRDGERHRGGLVRTCAAVRVESVASMPLASSRSSRGVALLFFLSGVAGRVTTPSRTAYPVPVALA